MEGQLGPRGCRLGAREGGAGHTGPSSSCPHLCTEFQSLSVPLQEPGVCDRRSLLRFHPLQCNTAGLCDIPGTGAGQGSWGRQIPQPCAVCLVEAELPRTPRPRQLPSRGIPQPFREQSTGWCQRLSRDIDPLLPRAWVSAGRCTKNKHPHCLVTQAAGRCRAKREGRQRCVGTAWHRHGGAGTAPRQLHADLMAWHWGCGTQTQWAQHAYVWGCAAAKAMGTGAVQGREWASGVCVSMRAPVHACASEKLLQNDPLLSMPWHPAPLQADVPCQARV